MRLRIVWAVMRRDFAAYFGGLTGYVFITLFMLLSAIALFWPASFWQANLANLETLNDLFPYVLLFIVPAITMSAWADERRHGVDELLLTLPVRDLELVAGKYLGAVATYTVAIAFMLAFWALLGWLGDPDAGLLFSNFYAYWLFGVALLAVGLVGSALTDNLTVGFILGAAFCAVPVFLHHLSGLARFLRNFSETAGAVPHFREMTAGVVDAASVVYFLALAGAMFYLNLVLVGRKRWREPLFGLHVMGRVAGALIAGISLVVLAGRMSIRADLTAERLHSVSGVTKEVIAKIDPQNPVYVQAFVSREVPRAYVETRANLLNLLREFAAKGGSKVQIQVVETERYTAAAREAEERFGIRPVELSDEQGGRREQMHIFLGFAATCGADEIVVPFLYRGLSVEYELTRAVSIVSRPAKAAAAPAAEGGEDDRAATGRLKVGILETDAKVFGGFDIQTMQSQPEWEFAKELKRQYEVVPVPANGPYPGDLAVLIAVMPSSLTQIQMDALKSWIQKGKPTLLLDDPFPTMNPGLAASKKEKGGNRNPFSPGGPPPEDKGNFNEIMLQCGLRWDMGEIVWDKYNPHNRITVQPEIVFCGTGNGAKEALNRNDVTTAGLQEIVLIFAGCVEPRGTPGVNFTPLLTTGKISGANAFSEVFEDRFFFGQHLRPERKHKAADRELTLAARLTGSVNVIFVPDTDFIGEQFFDIRRQGLEDLELDNVTFVLNCVDHLAGDETFIELRKRRRKHRTLLVMDEHRRELESSEGKDRRDADEAAEKRIQEAKDRFEEALKKLREREDLDPTTKETLLAQMTKVEQRKLDEDTKRIEDEKASKMESARTRTKEAMDGLIGRIKLLSTLLPPVPALLIGLGVWLAKSGRERGMAAGDRWVGGK